MNDLDFNISTADIQGEISTAEIQGEISGITYFVESNNYNDLINHPRINGHELIGNVSSSDLGISASNLESISVNNNPIQVDENKNADITDSVNGLIRTAISGITGLEYEVVQTLPTVGRNGVIYLMPNSGSTPNIYDEYIYVNGSFEKIGTTEVDLSQYYTKTETNGLLSAKANTNDIPTKTSDLTNDSGFVTRVGSEVYVGTEPPEDDNVNFWVNPDDNSPYPDFAEMSVDHIVVGEIESKNLLPVESSFTVTNTQRSRTVTGLNLKANQEYMLSCTNITSDNTYQYLFFFNVGQSSQFSVCLTNTQYYTTFTPTVDVNSVAIYSSNSYNASANYTTTYTNLMIEEGDTQTSYLPYKAFDSTAYVLWTNSSPASEFAGQTITLSDSIENYKYYEVIYRDVNSIARYSNTGRIPVGSLTEIKAVTYYIRRRVITAMSGTSVTFSGGLYYATYGNGTDTNSNGSAVPYQILGYK